MHLKCTPSLPQCLQVRFKIERNIGLAFVRMGQYQDAHQHFSVVMDSVPDHQTGYNLLVCSYALGSVEGMRNAFLRLLEVSQLSHVFWGRAKFRMSFGCSFAKFVGAWRIRN